MNIDKDLQREYIFKGLVPLDSRGVKAYNLLSVVSSFFDKRVVVPSNLIAHNADLASGSVIYFLGGVGNNEYEEPLYPACIANRKVGRRVEYFFEPGADADTCKDCIFNAFECPLKRHLNAQNIELLSPDIQQPHYDLESIYNDLSTLSFNQNQYKFPVVDTRRTANSIYEIYGKEFMNSANWKKIVRYFSFYDNYSASGEVKHKLDANEALNAMRLYANGLPSALIMDVDRRTKIASRFFQSLKYALSDENYKTFVNQFDKLT
jgi:hypothetical protein